MEISEQPQQQLLAMSQGMLAAAQQGNWEQLAVMERNRLALFQQVFAQVDAANAALAQQVLSLDEKIMELAKAAMPALQQELQVMRSSSKASNAYQTIQGYASGNSRG